MNLYNNLKAENVTRTSLDYLSLQSQADFVQTKNIPVFQQGREHWDKFCSVIAV
jgi:hypothetical protein